MNPTTAFVRFLLFLIMSQAPVNWLGIGVVMAQPTGPQFQPVPPPPPMPREKRLHWVAEAESAGKASPAKAPRMSREERRALRNEINEAGREIYPRHHHRRQQETAN